jgi:hypothetical protein
MKYFIIAANKSGRTIKNLNDMEVAHAITILFRLLEGGWKEFSVLQSESETIFRFRFEGRLPRRKDWLKKRISGEFAFYDLASTRFGVGQSQIAAEQDLEAKIR